MIFRVNHILIALSLICILSCGGSAWSPSKENVNDRIRSHDFFKVGSTVKIVSFDERVQRFHVFSLSGLPSFDESFEVPTALKQQINATVNEQSRVISHPKGNYYILIRGGAAQIVSSKGLAQESVYTMPRKIDGYNFLPEKGILILRDEVGSISFQKLSESGSLIERWEKGPLISNASVAGNLKSIALISEQTMVALSSKNILFEVNLATNSTLEGWETSSLNIPSIAGQQIEWILARESDKSLFIKTNSKALLFNIENKTVTNEIAIVDTPTVLIRDHYGKQFVVVGTAGNYRLLYGESQSIVERKIFTQYQEGNVVVLALDINSEGTEITTIIRNSDQVVKLLRMRLSDGLLLSEFALDQRAHLSNIFENRYFQQFPSQLGQIASGQTDGKSEINYLRSYNSEFIIKELL